MKWCGIIICLKRARHNQICLRRSLIRESYSSHDNVNKVADKTNHLNMDDNMSVDPNGAWEVIKKHQKRQVIDPPDPETVPRSQDKVRFVCVSDTHSKTDDLRHAVPEGDVLLHAGDFTRRGTLEEAKKFNDWLGTLSHPHKVIIAGNHETLFDNVYPQAVDPKDVLTNATYLYDSRTSVYGIKIYGSPWTPIYHVNAFNLKRGEPLRKKWAAIPDDVDILMTHGPPLGRGDLSRKHNRSGCVDLLHTVQSRVKPKYHVFGHIHEGYGMSTDGHTSYINASTCNVKYEPVNRAIIFDMPLPEGYSKKSL